LIFPHGSGQTGRHESALSKTEQPVAKRSGIVRIGANPDIRRKEHHDAQVHRRGGIDIKAFNAA